MQLPSCFPLSFFLSETSMSICSGRWWCGACPEPTSCLFTSTSIHQSGILIYRPSKRLGSRSSTTHSHLSKQLTRTHAVSQSCFTSPIGRGQMVALQCHGLQSGFWIGLDWRKKLLEPAGASTRRPCLPPAFTLVKQEPSVRFLPAPTFLQPSLQSTTRSA